MTNDLIQHKIIKTGNTVWKRNCMSCKHEFESGEDRHEWRTFITYGKDNNTFQVNGWWTTNCHECFVRNMIALRDTFNEQVGAIPNSMMDLIQ